MLCPQVEKLTYCVAISTGGGLVFCSDSRTNAGPDMLSSYSKMHIFGPTPDRVFVTLAAGNLATTQAIVNHIEQDMESPDTPGLHNCSKMVEAARYVSRVIRTEVEQAQANISGSGVDTSVTLIFGGQVVSGAPAIYLMYPAGNFITDSDENPFLQIGESKYGKPILDRIVTRSTSLEDAARCAIVSMDSTIKSNATVGPPIEVLVYEQNSFSTSHYIKMEEDDPYLREIKQSWNDALKTAFSKMPPFHWESRTNPNQEPVADNFNEE
jgi:putative proteasome-type protease